MKNRKTQFVLLIFFICAASSIYGMKKFLQIELVKGSSAIKNLRVPKGFENHKKLLTEPWQLSDASWRKNILMPTIGSTLQTAMWASLSYVVGVPIYVIKLDTISHVLKNSWKYAQSYFIPYSQDSLKLSEKNVSEVESPKKIET